MGKLSWSSSKTYQRACCKAATQGNGKLILCYPIQSNCYTNQVIGAAAAVGAAAVGAARPAESAKSAKPTTKAARRDCELGSIQFNAKQYIDQ